MGGTADRKKFGQSLDDSQDDGVPHGAVKHQTNVSCPGRLVKEGWAVIPREHLGDHLGDREPNRFATDG
jgi:hypothetical protein